MHKIILFLSCLICVVSAGRLGIERKLSWLQNVRQQQEEPTNLAPETTTGRWKQMQEQQLFLLDVLLQVSKPLVNQKLIELGKVLIMDPAMYLERTDELLMEFLEKCRQHEILGRDQIYSELNIEHARQLVGLTKFLTLAKDWPTFQRNVCFARLHINPVLFVNALLRAIRERMDTTELIVPAMNEIIPQLFYDKEVIMTAENVDWHDLLIGPTMSVKPSFMNMLQLNRMVHMILPINWIHIGKSGRWQPWRVQTARIGDQTSATKQTPMNWNMNNLKNLENDQSNIVNDPNNLMFKSETKFVIPVEQKSPLSHLTDDIGLNIFWNEAMNERLIQTLTGEKRQNINWSTNWNLNKQVRTSDNANINHNWIPMQSRQEQTKKLWEDTLMNHNNWGIIPERRQTIDEILNQERMNSQIGVENLPSSNTESERLLHVGRRRQNMPEVINEPMWIKSENVREPLWMRRQRIEEPEVEEPIMMDRQNMRQPLAKKQPMWLNRESSEQPTWMNRQRMQTQIDIDTEVRDQEQAIVKKLIGNGNNPWVDTGRIIAVDRNTNNPWMAERDWTLPKDIIKDSTINGNNRWADNDRVVADRTDQNQDTVKELIRNGNDRWMNNGRVGVVDRNINNPWMTEREWTLPEDTVKISTINMNDQPAASWENIGDGDNDRLMARIDNERERVERITRSIKNLDISPTEDLMSIRSGEIFIQNLRQLMARINMEKLSLDLKESESVDESVMAQLLTTNDVQYQERVVSKVVARQKIQQSIQQLQSIIDYALDNARIQRNDPDVIRIIGDLLIENNGRMSNVWDELYNQINVFVYGQLSSVEQQQQATVLSIPSGNLREPIYLDIVESLNKLIDSYVQNLQPYTRAELSAPGIAMKSIDVDQLVTYFDVTDADLINLVDQQLLQSSTNNLKRSQKQLVARQKRLNHKQFTLGYEILSERNQRVVVRTFIGPQMNVQNRLMDEMRQSFMLLDAFVKNLELGLNRIERNSRDITWTTRDTTTLREIYRIVMSGMLEQNLVKSNCRFPHRLLIPRGTIDGVPMQLFVIVTPVTEDDRRVQRMVNPNSICGLGVAGMSLDTLPLNFPLDRKIESSIGILQDNMILKDVLIMHDEHIEMEGV